MILRSAKMLLLTRLALIQTACPVARCITSEENSMEKIHIERHEAEYRIDGLTLTEGGFWFHLRQKNIPLHLFRAIRRGLHTKQAVTLYRVSDQADWVILFPLS
jgi:hypothetical protein